MVAAVGGMVVPVLVYLALNRTGDGRAGWGIPMATDIAFAVGVLVLLGARIPAALKVLLLALAIVDDIGAIVVIAVAYTDELSVGWLLLAATGLVVVAGLRRAKVRFPPAYLVLGLFVWVATLESGIHATIAGVALALLTPVEPSARTIEDTLHPWVSYIVVPVFALANAGIPLNADALEAAAGSSITIGVGVGLVVGKFAGVLGASALAVRVGVGRLPEGVGWTHMAGVAALAGIGFTVSIFVSGLALQRPLAAGRGEDRCPRGVGARRCDRVPGALPRSAGERGRGVDEELGQVAVAVSCRVESIGGQPAQVVADDRRPVGDLVEAGRGREDGDLLVVAVVAPCTGVSQAMRSAPRSRRAATRVAATSAKPSGSASGLVPSSTTTTSGTSSMSSTCSTPTRGSGRPRRRSRGSRTRRRRAGRRGRRTGGRRSPGSRPAPAPCRRLPPAAGGRVGLSVPSSRPSPVPAAGEPPGSSALHAPSASASARTGSSSRSTGRTAS